MPRVTADFPFSPGDRVVMDDDAELVCRVDSVALDQRGHCVLVYWFQQGVRQTLWVDPHQLTELRVERRS